ncbi:MAG: phosphatase PAP2 family protein [Ferruginibacter sp.]|nr:phosphatase PAP2 family protein [Ferruginibacter sp.]
MSSKMPIKRLVHIVFYCVLFQSVSISLFSQNVDIDILRSLNPKNPHAVYWKAASSSYLLVSGTATFGTLAYALIKKDTAMQHNAGETILALAIDVVATEGLKRLINRTRPQYDYPTEVYVVSKTQGKSFPSGHTSFAFATATSFAIQYKKWYVVVPAYLWAGSVGYSRMYLGKHYPSDVLGGAIVGAGSSLLSHWLNKKFFQKK